MKSAVLFIHSQYPKEHLSFYKKLCRGKFKIAVDGGYSFFKKAKIRPDIIIGDFDSLRKESVKGVNLLSFPIRKDATDTELAVNYCIDMGFQTIDIVAPNIGEPDHFLGLAALLLMPQLSALNNKRISARIISHECEIIFLKNCVKRFTNCKDELLSVVPHGGAVKLTCTGLDYWAKGLIIKPWQTRGMRNIISSNQAEISVTGTAMVIHYWKKIS